MTGQGAGCPEDWRSVSEKKMNHEKQVLELTAYAKQVEAPEDAMDDLVQGELRIQVAAEAYVDPVVGAEGTDIL